MLTDGIDLQLSGLFAELPRLSPSVAAWLLDGLIRWLAADDDGATVELTALGLNGTDRQRWRKALRNAGIQTAFGLIHGDSYAARLNRLERMVDKTSRIRQGYLYQREDHPAFAWLLKAARFDKLPESGRQLRTVVSSENQLPLEFQKLLGTLAIDSKEYRSCCNHD